MTSLAPRLLLSAAALLVCTLAGPLSPASAATTTVTTAAELTEALAQARAGDTITLRDGKYLGSFTGAAAGTAAAPITLIGSPRAVLSTGSVRSDYGLHITGNYWKLTGFSVSVAKKGIMLDNSDGTVIDGVDVGSIGQEAIHVRTSSSGVTVRNSRVHDTGLRSASYGEGIYVGSANSNWSSIMGSSSTPDRSDGVLIENNTVFNTTAEGIDIKEGTTGGRILGNTFTNAGWSGRNSADSFVDVKGNGYLVSGNSGSGTLLDAFQVHSVLTGWGGSNEFRSNTVLSGVPGYEVRIASKTPGNIVRCDSSAAGLGLSNVTCQ